MMRLALDYVTSRPQNQYGYILRPTNAEIDKAAASPFTPATHHSGIKIVESGRIPIEDTLSEKDAIEMKLKNYPIGNPPKGNNKRGF